MHKKIITSVEDLESDNIMITGLKKQNSSNKYNSYELSFKKQLESAQNNLFLQNTNSPKNVSKNNNFMSPSYYFGQNKQVSRESGNLHKKKSLQVEDFSYKNIPKSPYESQNFNNLITEKSRNSNNSSSKSLYAKDRFSNIEFLSEARLSNRDLIKELASKKGSKVLSQYSRSEIDFNFDNNEKNSAANCGRQKVFEFYNNVAQLENLNNYKSHYNTHEENSLQPSNNFPIKRGNSHGNTNPLENLDNLNFHQKPRSKTNEKGRLFPKNKVTSGSVNKNKKSLSHKPKQNLTSKQIETSFLEKLKRLANPMEATCSNKSVNNEKSNKKKNKRQKISSNRQVNENKMNLNKINYFGIEQRSTSKSNTQSEINNFNPLSTYEKWRHSNESKMYNAFDQDTSVNSKYTNAYTYSAIPTVQPLSVSNFEKETQALVNIASKVEANKDMMNKTLENASNCSRMTSKFKKHDQNFKSQRDYDEQVKRIKSSIKTVAINPKTDITQNIKVIRSGSNGKSKKSTTKKKSEVVPFYNEFQKNFTRKDKSTLRNQNAPVQSAKQLPIGNYRAFVKINKKTENKRSTRQSKASTKSINDLLRPSILSNSTTSKSKLGSFLKGSVIKDSNVREKVANYTIDKLKTQSKDNQYVTNIMFDQIKRHAIYNKHFLKDMNSIVN